MLNITDVDLPTSKLIEIGAKTSAPLLIMMLIFIFVVLSIIGLFSVKESKGKFFAIVLMTLIISIMFLTAIILLPNTMYNFAQFFIKLFG